MEHQQGPTDMKPARRRRFTVKPARSRRFTMKPARRRFTLFPFSKSELKQTFERLFPKS